MTFHFRIVLMAFLLSPFAGFSQTELTRDFFSNQQLINILSLEGDQKEAFKNLQELHISENKQLDPDASLTAFMEDVDQQQDWFYQFGEILNEAQRDQLEALWREKQLSAIAQTISKQIPDIEISATQARAFQELLIKRQMIFLESLSSSDFKSVLDQEQKEAFESFQQIKEDEIAEEFYEEQEFDELRKFKESVVLALQALNRNYILPLREIRTELNKQISIEDQNLIASQRQIRRNIIEPAIAEFKEQTEKDKDFFFRVEQVALNPMQYAMYHFPKDYRDDMPTTAFDSSELEDQVLRDLIDRNLKLLKPLEVQVIQIINNTNNAYQAIVDSHVGKDATHEMSVVFLHENDNISDELWEVILLMEPLDINDSSASYPNPFSINGMPESAWQEQRVHFYLPLAGDIKLDIVDEDHKLVKEIQKISLPKGDQEIQVDLSQIKEGFYFYRLNCPAGKYLWPLLVEK